MSPFSSSCAPVISFIVSLLSLLSYRVPTYLYDIEKHKKKLENLKKSNKVKNLKKTKSYGSLDDNYGLGNLEETNAINVEPKST